MPDPLPPEEVYRNLSLVDFVPKLSPEFQAPFHLGEWCWEIEGSLIGGTRALCEIPVRHFKSETTYHGIAWLLLRDPSLRILVMVADHEMAAERGKRIREICEAAGVGPVKGHDTILSWRNEDGGGVMCMSAKQSRLGQDVDILIFDDPISELDVGNQVVRDSVDRAIAHYTARAGRIGRRGSVLGIMSRWHPDDPIGRRRARTAVDWKVMSASAITYHLGSEDGEKVAEDKYRDKLTRALAPGVVERAFAPHVMTLAELNKRRAELREADPSERIWYAQFQNDPKPDALGLFKNPQRYEALPGGAGFRTAFGVDLQYSSSLSADYFALVVLRIWSVSIWEGDHWVQRDTGYVLNAWRERWDPAMAAEILVQAKKMYPDATAYTYASGPEIGTLQYLATRGIHIEYIPARYNKRVRAQRTIDLSNAGRILLPVAAPWVNGMVARLMLFSGDENAGGDDEADALVSAVDGSGMGGVGVAPKTLGKRRI